MKQTLVRESVKAVFLPGFLYTKKVFEFYGMYTICAGRLWWFTGYFVSVILSEVKICCEASILQCNGR